MAIPPSAALGVGQGFSVGGAEWKIDSLPGISEGGQGSGEAGFGGMLSGELAKLSGMQVEAAEASKALATGQASDVSSVVMSVERAKLAMQLASQIRRTGVESYQEIFRTQV